MFVPLVDLKIQYQKIKADIDAAISDVFEQSNFILGENVNKFENEFCQYLGGGRAVSVHSGTDALYLSLLACGISSGDEVITVAHTFIEQDHVIILEQVGFVVRKETCRIPRAGILVVSAAEVLPLCIVQDNSGTIKIAVCASPLDLEDPLIGIRTLPRFVVKDRAGAICAGDHIITICASAMKEKGLLKNNKIIITPMSNFGMRKALQELDIQYEDAEVGDRNVLELMRKSGAVLGGEQSGHIIYMDHHTTGDGIISALQLLAVMKQSGKNLSELAAVFETTPQKLINVDVAGKPDLNEVAEVAEAIKKELK